MSKILNCAAAFLMALTANFANAEFSGPDKTPTYTSVSEVGVKPVVGSKVILTGNILQKVLDKQYTFHDKTGETTVVINKKAFDGIEISPTTLVEMEGVIANPSGKRAKKHVRSSNNQFIIRIHSIKVIK